MKKIFLILAVLCIPVMSATAFDWWPFGNSTTDHVEQLHKAETKRSKSGNRHSQSFYAVKREMLDKVYYDHRQTLYCGADFTLHKKIILPYGFKLPNLRQVDFNVYDNITVNELQQKAERMEWEHIVPAQNFGKTFHEWTKGHKNCVSQKGKSFKGRQCAVQENEDFRYMYADMYNLYPVIGAVNYLRAHFSPTQFATGQKNIFGSCNMKISRNKMEPPDEVKGLIARTYLYMQATYPRYSIGEPAESVLKAWAKQYPVTKWECVRAYRIEKIQGNANKITQKECLAKNWYKDDRGAW